MGLIAELGRLAIGAWSPGGVGGGYIAAATYNAPENSFASDPRLELVSLDITRSKLSVITDIPVPEKFSSLDWSTPGGPYPAGLIAGGLIDGTVRVWDAATLIRSTNPNDPNRAVLFGGSSSAKKHNAAVRGLAFNPFKLTRLASGGADGNVLIWDLGNPSVGANVRHPAGQQPSGTGAPRDEVTSVAWNRKVPHVLGSATSGGVMSVWDLKQSKQVISIRNPRGRFPCSSLVWHPEIATQVVVTCDDDESTGALLWDLRNASAPVMTYTHHSPRGVASSSWCNFDTDLLLTCSRDSRTVVVSIATGEVVSETPKSANWNFDVKWSPRIPGLYLSSSFDGRLAVNSMMTATTAPSVSSETANALAESFGEMAGGFQSGLPEQSPRTAETRKVSYNASRPPKWLRRPSCTSFSFGGVRASLASKERGGSTVALESFDEGVCGLPENSTKLDSVLMDLTADDPAPALKWCQEASVGAETPKERMIWDGLSVMFQTDARRKLLVYLGFEVPPPDAGDEIAMPVYGLARSPPLAVPVRPAPPPAADLADTKPDPSSQIDMVTNGANAMSLSGPAPWEIGDPASDNVNVKDSILDGDDTANSGEELASNKQNGLSAVSMNGSKPKSFSEMSHDEVDVVLKKAVIVGDFRTAVDACLHTGRAADALIIAQAGGPDLWTDTQAEYLTKASLSEGATIVGAIAGPKSKMDDFIRQSAEAGKDSWKQSLAVILTYTPAEELLEACTALGERLLFKNEHEAALFCFICANNTKLAVSTWMRERLSYSRATSAMMAERIERLVSVVGKVRLLTAATLLAHGEREIGAVKAMDALSGSVLCEFGALLAMSSDLSMAITYLSNLDPGCTCVYGTAGELHAKTTETLTMTDSAVVSSPQTVAAGNATGRAAYGNMFQPAPHGYDRLSDYSTSPGMWTPQTTPAAPPLYGTHTGGAQPYGHVAPTAPSTSVMGSPPPTQAVYSSRAGAIEPATYDPSDAYAAAPTYNQGSYQMPSVPAPPNTGFGSASLPPNQFSGGVTPLMPTPPMPSISPIVPPVAAPQIGYGLPPPIPPEMTSGTGMPVHPLVPHAPPPPPTDYEGPPPMPYHINARPGSGATLPPSAEIAVAETRRSKPMSTSGTPGGPPRRTNSTSSSLSALGIETVLLEKADTSKLPANQQVIVKSLRGSYMYARTRNESPRYKKKMDDVSKRLGKLVAALNNGLVDPSVVELLVSFGEVVEKGNYDEASVIVNKLTKQYWDSNSQWIQGLKRLIDCVLTGR